MKKIKWGIIGPGKIADKFATDLQEVEHAELYAVASRSQTKAKSFAKKHQATNSYSSYETMLQDEELDVVYIATPHVFHHAQTLMCFEYNKAVLCEKPFGMNRQQVEEMIAKAKQKNVFLMEALWTQFLPHFKAVMEIIKSKKYGAIKSLEANFGFNAAVDLEKRLYNKSLGGGSLLDIGIYPIFMALSALGMPQNIKAEGKFYKTGIDQQTDMTFEYANNVNATLQSSIIQDTSTTAVIEMEKATLKLNYQFHAPTSFVVITDEGEEIKEFDVHTRGYNFEAEHVQKMLWEGKTESTEMTFEKSLQLIELLDKVKAKIGLKYN